MTMAGSQDNAVALATALRTGAPASLTFTSTSPTGEATQTAIELAVPTKPMGWGNVSHALALAQFSLRQAGIDNPTATDLQAALNGGTVTTADGKTVTLAGVLQQRAGGMGWGLIAKTYGTTMGAVNRGLKVPATTVASSASPPVGSTTTAKRTVATGATNGRGASAGKTTSGLNTKTGVPGHGSKGITTATGAVGNNGASAHSAKGITNCVRCDSRRIIRRCLGGRTRPRQPNRTRRCDRSWRRRIELRRWRPRRHVGRRYGVRRQCYGGDHRATRWRRWQRKRSRKEQGRQLISRVV